MANFSLLSVRLVVLLLGLSVCDFVTNLSFNFFFANFRCATQIIIIIIIIIIIDRSTTFVVYW